MKTKILIGLILILILTARPLLAQSRSSQGGRIMRSVDSLCWNNPRFGATDEQLRDLEEVHRSYIKSLEPYRNQYIVDHHELRAHLSSRNPDPGLVMEKQSRLSAVQNRIDEISLRHYLRAKRIFTREQISRLPYNCRLGFTYGKEMGPSRGRGGGTRWGGGR
jgi:hypothetical protein